MGALYYTVIPRKNPVNKEVKYYAQVKNYTPIDKNKIIELAEKNSNINRTILEAVFSAWERAMANYFTRGHNMQLWPLGSFYSTIKSRGASTPDNFSAGNIKGLKMNFVASPALKYLAMKENMSFKLYTPKADSGEEGGESGE